jgi:SAM-dependent methyltransferase
MTCLICGSSARPSGTLFSSFSDRTFSFARCEDCGYGWVSDPREDYATLYDEAYYVGQGADPGVNYQGQFLGSPDSLLTKIKNVEFDALLRTMTTVQRTRLQGEIRSMKILDFGGGVGGFVNYLNARGLDAELHDEGYGLEFAAAHGVRVQRSLDDVTERYDVVFAVEVLEHLKDPHAALATIQRVLKPGGLLLFTTGNLARHRGPVATWFYARHPEVHISFFTPNAFGRLAGQHGLRPLRVRFAPGAIQYRALMRAPVFKRLAYVTRTWWRPLTIVVERRLGFSELGAAERVREESSAPNG